MRRRSRRRKSWFARLFSFGAHAKGKPHARPEESADADLDEDNEPPRTLDPAKYIVLRDPSRPRKSARQDEPEAAQQPSLPTASSEATPATPRASTAREATPAAPRVSSERKPGVPPTAKNDAAPRAKVPAPPGSPPSGDAAPELPAPPKSWLVGYWRKVGGGSLMVSFLIHLALFVIGSFVVTSVVRKPPIDFLSGGGSKSGQAASQELAQQVKMKKRSVLNKSVPPRQIVSLSNATAIVLPELPMNTMDLPEISSPLGGQMGSGGFGSQGAGGGYGSGVGIGGLAGRSFKPIVMFGKSLNARSIAVILDVSGSMTPHLSEVIRELDRVAKGSPVILYVGCGVSKPPSGVRIDDQTTETRRTARFRPYWQADHGPEKDVYAILEKRPYTYFIKSQGIQYAWVSLLADEVRHAEALYWFSDFQDDVDDVQMESVLENLKRRKQKLFIHASDEGSSFEKIRDKLCLPSGGLVIRSGR